jgi:hypothetical protein
MIHFVLGLPKPRRPDAAVGSGLFYLFAFESKLSTLTKKKAQPLHGRAL